MTQPDLSIVTVSYNVRDLLKRCLESVVGATRGISAEIFVVDNASTDGSAEMVRADFPGFRLVANPENRGFAAANNQALRESAGRYVMLLNPDTVVPPRNPNALEILVRFMDAHPRAGACGAKLRYGDGTLQHSAFMFPGLKQVYFDLFPAPLWDFRPWRLLESRLNGRYPKSQYESGRPFQVDHPLGAALMVRRAAAEQVGWLDEAYFIYVEEVDWCRRIRRAGWEIWCVPEAEIIHYEAQSTRQFRERMFVELWRARLHYFQKHHSPIYNALLGILIRAGMRRAQDEARRARARGEISEEELARRLDAYATVRREA